MGLTKSAVLRRGTLTALAVAAIVGIGVFCRQSSRSVSADETGSSNLIAQGDFQDTGDSNTAPQGFTTTGDVAYGPLGNPEREQYGSGFKLLSASKDGAPSAGEVSTTIKDLSPNAGRWYRFRVRGLAQNGFSVDQEDLYLKIDFYSSHGTNWLDNVDKEFYDVVQLDRKNLADTGTNKNLGPSSWRSYDLDFHTPFPEVDTVKLTVGFGMGNGKDPHSEFWVGSEELTPIPVPANYVPPKGGQVFLSKVLASEMVPLGGRWYYDPIGGSPTPPAQFDYTNSSRLFYLSDRLEAPFADNMSAWLKKGDLDLNGNLVTKDVYIPDNVVVSFTKTDLVIRSHNLPNHPTAIFPDTEGLLDGNPNYIQEKSFTWHIPLNPQVNPNHIAMANQSNSNNALPMGPIGVAVNGIVFFNPFDAGEVQALWRVDRCCGHPSPDYTYHYHKYPVCVKSPWADDGADHSPLIGFAFDGFPIYGPYEAKGIMAKDDQANPLNAFNMHYDKDRGWHYHVTPGQFPHIIGGYWGNYDRYDNPRMASMPECNVGKRNRSASVRITRHE